MNWRETPRIYTGFLIGLLLAGFSKYSDKRNIKKHFGFSYNNFAANILFVVTLAALFGQPFKLLSFLALAGICYYYIRYALAEQSFLFLLLSVVYSYIGLTYCFFSYLLTSGETSLFIGFFYVAASCVGIILFFINYKKILRIKK